MKANIRKIFLIVKLEFIHSFSWIWIVFIESYHCLFISYLHIWVFSCCFVIHMCGLAAAAV